MFIFSTFRDCLRILVIHDAAAIGEAVPQELLPDFFHHLGQLGKLDLETSAARQGFVASWLAPA